VAMLSSVRDVTRRWQAEEARREAELALRTLNEELEARVRERTRLLDEANQSLAEAARHKDEFLANMSHELRTPLTGILSFIEVLQQGVYGPLNERQLRALQMVDDSSRHLLQLINDLLDIARVEAGTFELELSDVDLADLARASMHVIAPLAAAKDQRTSFEIHPTPLILYADQRRLKQILINLLSNAVKFTPVQGAFGLEIAGNRQRGTVAFTVWDTGIGIAPEQQTRLFKPFVQLDSSLNRKYAGTGLGLALVRRLAELHGGHVALASEPGAGSRFTVTLPWVESATGETTQMQMSGAAPGVAPASAILDPSRAIPSENN
jgi:signal transduction histidine kinase